MLTQTQQDQLAVLQAQLTLTTAQYNLRVNQINTQIAAIQPITPPVTDTTSS